MHPILRAALTVLLLIALSWPLLFWGKPALSGYRDRHPEVGQPAFNKMPRHDAIW